MTFRLTMLLDNKAPRADLQTAWGFSALIEVGDQRVLFDTGWDGDQVLANANTLGESLDDLDAIVLSHRHWDHAGGLARLLQVIQRTRRIFLPTDFSQRQSAEIARRVDEMITVDDARVLLPGIASTGTLPSPGDAPGEQSLVLLGSEGPVVVSGCAHPGVGTILTAAETHFGPPRGLIGGLHGFDDLDRLAGLDLLVPSHCTQRTSEILARYPAAHEGHVGLVIDDLPDPT
ncbi:MAG: MBL fold metallo-hydrolase [Deltaproteobacteria bacterium]|nr:MBL fold metallo-hydrolase [Deltaproteobacteria bacterium]